jgi:hypothetical protein
MMTKWYLEVLRVCCRERHNAPTGDVASREAAGSKQETVKRQKAHVAPLLVPPTVHLL